MKSSPITDKKISKSLHRNASFPKIWYRELLKEQADLEKMRLETVQRIVTALNRLNKKYRWDEAYLIGSVAEKGKFRRNSDIDIAVKGLNKYDYYEFVGAISSLLGKRVDVIVMEECHFADAISKKGIKWNHKSRF